MSLYEGFLTSIVEALSVVEGAVFCLFSVCLGSGGSQTGTDP
jgi:hypothetical protein